MIINGFEESRQNITFRKRQSMNGMKKTKVYDVAKVIVSLLVVVGHTTRMYTPTGVYVPLNESVFLNYLTEYIYKFHMPLFICISGCIYGYCIDQGKYKNTRLFLLNKVKRLLIPYLFCGFFYVAPIMQLLKIDTMGYWKYCLSGIILSHNARHLWFILALFWIFVLATFMKPLLNSPKGVVVLIVISYILHRYAYSIPAAFQIPAACNYQIYFFIGIFLNRFYEKVENALSKFRYIFMIFPVILVNMFVWNPNQMTNTIYIFMGMTMIMVFSHWCVSLKSNVLNTFLYKCIQKNTFGIYLFHPMIIYVLFYLFGDYDISPYLLSGGIFLISIAVSMIIAYVIRSLHLEILIGESD